MIKCVGVIMLVPLWTPESETNSIYGPDNGTSVAVSLVLNFPNKEHFDLAKQKYRKCMQITKC